jgi:hypothetical protein
MSTANVQLYLLGTLWEVEVDFTYDPAEDSTGLAEHIYIEAVWLLGYYPEGSGKARDMVPCHIKADLQCMSNADDAALTAAVEQFIAEQAREAFDYNHSYED